MTIVAGTVAPKYDLWKATEDFLTDNDEKVASSKNIYMYIQFKTRRKNHTLFMAKRAENHYTLWGCTYIYCMYKTKAQN